MLSSLFLWVSLLTHSLTHSAALLLAPETGLPEVRRTSHPYLQLVALQRGGKITGNPEIFKKREEGTGLPQR
jgi:hypothetical protein